MALLLSFLVFSLCCVLYCRCRKNSTGVENACDPETYHHNLLRRAGLARVGKLDPATLAQQGAFTSGERLHGISGGVPGMVQRSARDCRTGRAHAAVWEA